MSTTDSPDEPQSRLDRELTEILERSRNRPVSFQDHVARKRNAMVAHKQTTGQRFQHLAAGPLRTAQGWALRIPLLTALMLALLAVWLSPEYQLAASLLAITAAVLIFLPFVHRPPESDPVHRARWRGRVISSSPPARGERRARSWIDSARDRFGR